MWTDVINITFVDVAFLSKIKHLLQLHEFVTIYSISLKNYTCRKNSDISTTIIFLCNLVFCALVTIRYCPSTAVCFALYLSSCYISNIDTAICIVLIYIFTIIAVVKRLISKLWTSLILLVLWADNGLKLAEKKVALTLCQTSVVSMMKMQWIFSAKSESGSLSIFHIKQFIRVHHICRDINRISCIFATHI